MNLVKAAAHCEKDLAGRVVSGLNPFVLLSTWHTMNAEEWNSIMEVGLTCLQRIDANADMEALQKEIVLTGYRAAPRPHSDVRDLVYTFSSSLYNVANLSRNMQAFAEMCVSGAEDFISDNTVSKIPEMAGFAEKCLAHLDKESSIPLAQDDREHRDNLKRLAADKPQSHRGHTNKLQAVLDFCDLIRKYHHGSAAAYHSHIAGAKVQNKISFLRGKVAPLARISGVRSAVALNFLKDSQVTAFQSIAPAEALVAVRNSPVGLLVKPDRHVMRLMLKITGRAASARLGDRELSILGENELEKYYCANSPTGGAGWPTKYSVDDDEEDCARWRCVEDIVEMAQTAATSPFEVDRLLYLIGSGKFPRLEGEHPHIRYRRAMAAISA